MFGKLIKYDFRSCRKKFWSLWAGLIALSLISGIAWRITLNGGHLPWILNGLPTVILSSLGIATAVIAFLYIYDEFTNGLLGERGYLANTLPVTPEALIMSKALTALIMEVISAAVAGICALCMILIQKNNNLGYIITGLREFFKGCDGVGLIVLFLIECIVLALLTATCFNFHIYTASAAGHLSGKYKKLVWLIAFIAIGVLLSFFLAKYAGGIVESVYNRFSPGYLPDYSWKREMGASMAAVGVIIVMELIYSGLMFFVTGYVLKNKLNLE